MVSPSRCPPWQPERPGPTRREPRRARRSYTTRRDTIQEMTWSDAFTNGVYENMRITCVEIQNFRRLKCIRVDFSQQSTIFVGANNSGKTSALVALGHFLIDATRFAPKDFSLSSWRHIDIIGQSWVHAAALQTEADLNSLHWSVYYLQWMFGSTLTLTKYIWSAT